ncbi:substrate-binding domain-containing protein [Arthrobacter sp. OAP107]|uniref:substrate-binding domain-containing protein n=1 Tax=Arthrobacter sp. OAP107 TaxID=3156445 RepID=UPI0033936F37
MGRRVDGIILGPASGRHSFRAMEAARGTALVFLDAVPVGVPADTVTTDNDAGVVQTLRENGVNSSIALVGFDDFPLADVPDPGITVIAQDAEGIGRIAAEKLFARVDGFSGEPATHLIPATLKERGSGEIRLGSARRRPYVSAGIS